MHLQVDLKYLEHVKSIDIHIMLKYRELAKKFCLYVGCGSKSARHVSIREILITGYFHIKYLVCTYRFQLNNENFLFYIKVRAALNIQPKLIHDESYCFR